MRTPTTYAVVDRSDEWAGCIVALVCTRKDGTSVVERHGYTRIIPTRSIKRWSVEQTYAPD